MQGSKLEITFSKKDWFFIGLMTCILIAVLFWSWEWHEALEILKSIECEIPQDKVNKLYDLGILITNETRTATTIPYPFNRSD